MNYLSIDRFLVYVTSVRRFSVRTREIYADCLERFAEFAVGAAASDAALLRAMTPSVIRRYEVMLMNSGISPRTVSLHLSALSSFCKFLIKSGELASNPVKLVKKPKVAKRLPEFYRDSDMRAYFAATEIFASPIAADAIASASPEDFIAAYIASRPHGLREAGDANLQQMRSLAGDPQAFGQWLYRRRLERVVIATLFSTGLRRSELISLRRSSLDSSRMMLRVRGKGDKLREIPIISSLYEEISLYLQSVGTMFDADWTPSSPLFVSPSGRALYPALVDRLVKEGLGSQTGITGKKSPHVLRHTVATELLDSGADLNSIKEFLGHSSLAATQVYTHNTVAKLKKIYQTAHPRAKNGGKNGD